MSVLTLAGKAINWSKPPKATTRVMWSRRDMYGRKVTGSLRTIALLDHTDDLCVKKYGTHLVVIQPPYNTGVAASAGTHDYDACLDVYIPGVSWSNQEKFFRVNGWGAYHRKPPKFGHHIHMFALPLQEGKDRADDYHVAGFKVGRFVDGGWSLFKRKTTSAQIEAYYWGKDALASNGRDTGWRPPSIKATIFDLKAYIAKRAPKAPTKNVHWYTHVHLNTWGDDGGQGTRTLASRLPKMVADLTKPVAGVKPEVITLNEVRAKTQGPLWEAAMKKAGYRKVLIDGGNAAFVRMDLQTRRPGTGPIQAKYQGEGRKEMVSRFQVLCQGAWANIGTTHLDYRSGPKFDLLRVDQAKDFIRIMVWFGGVTLLPKKDRWSLGLDENSESWVWRKAFNPAGFKAVVKAPIDAIYTGAARVIRGTSKSSTSSDHPILRATYGKKP